MAANGNGHGTNGNGNGRAANTNGHGNGVSVRIDRLIEEKQRELDSLLVAKRLLETDLTVRKAPKMNGVVDQAIARTMATRAPTTLRPGEWKANKTAQRQHTAAYLASFSTTDPSLGDRGDRTDMRGIGILVHTGYLKRKRDGYIRTAKEFHP